MQRVLLEIAVDTVPDALAAAHAGADRLELCSALAQHGLSPSAELTRSVSAATSVPIMAMVRTTAAGFAHSAEEWRSHLHTAEHLLAAGAHGLVFGCLTPDSKVDAHRCREIVKLAAPRETVFHRAFDLVEDAPSAMRTLADAGVTRILTAGMPPAASQHAMGLPDSPPPAHPQSLDQRLAHLATLAHLARASGIQLIICGGLRAENVASFIARSGASQIHSAARLGKPATFIAEEVRAIRSVLDSYL